MRLFELAYFCGLYGCLTRYDVSLRALRSRGDAPDPFDATYRAALFAWLNDWGCRQFAIEHQTTTAAESLMEWAGSWLDRLPGYEVQLTDLSDAELDRSANAYDALRACTASTRLLRSGRRSKVTFGPVGAAKVLFALRPNAYPPWDNPIRAHFAYGTAGPSYRRYLVVVAGLLRRLAAEAHAPVADLPALVRRPDSSPPKLVDEYNWVVVTKGCRAPTAAEVAQWAEWASRT